PMTGHPARRRQPRVLRGPAAPVARSCVARARGSPASRGLHRAPGDGAAFDRPAQRMMTGHSHWSGRRGAPQGSGAARVWERHNVGTPPARHTEGWAARTGHGAARTPNLTPSSPVETHGRGGGTMTLPNDGAWTRRGRTASEGATAPATLRFRYGPAGL